MRKNKFVQLIKKNKKETLTYKAFKNVQVQEQKNG